MAKIGFIGLGHMGLPMATNLVKAGHCVTGFDIQPEAIQKLAAAGGQIATRLQQAAVEQDIIVTMLQTGQQVREVCLAEEGLFAHACPHTLHIDCSSIDVASSREVHEQARKRNLPMLDAPVSGGVAGATAASLTFMVGGEQAVLEQAKPILVSMGKKIIYTGKAGSGQAAKICNNMILGITMIGVAEAFLLAKQLDLDADKLHEVVSNASGQCWVMNHYVPVANLLPNVPANHDYQPGFTANMMLKDLLLSQEAASKAKLNTPMGAKASQLYQQLVHSGLGQLDFSAIIKLLTQERDSHE